MPVNDRCQTFLILRLAYRDVHWLRIFEMSSIKTIYSDTKRNLKYFLAQNSAEISRELLRMLRIIVNRCPNFIVFTSLLDISFVVIFGQAVFLWRFASLKQYRLLYMVKFAHIKLKHSTSFKFDVSKVRVSSNWFLLFYCHQLYAEPS